MMELRNGITLSGDEGWTIERDVAPPAMGLLGTKLAGEAVTTDLMVEALEQSDFLVAERLIMRPPAARLGLAPETAPTLQVPVDEHEHAVVLVESDRGFEWIAGATDECGDSVGFTRESTRLNFALPGVPMPPPAGRLMSLTGSGILNGLKVLVLKYVVAVPLAELIEHLERRQVPGLISVKGLDPGTWTHLGTPELVPVEGRPRILLLVHGWSSSTQGSFGGLCASDEGREFLRQAQDSYSAVLGFDHFTQSQTPLKNAELLYEALGKLDLADLEIDVICFSRGGLVTRSLIENVLPSKIERPSIRKVVFVAAANSGTKLADPDNWNTLLDAYTTVAMAGLRGIQFAIPSSTTFVVLLRGLLTGVAVFAKAIAAGAITDRLVPGVAAMDPDGPFIKALNATQPRQPIPSDVDYYAVTGNFEPSMAEASGTGEVAAKVAKMIRDKCVDDLFGEPNDAVVNTMSMTALDPGFDFAGKTFDTGPSGTVFHQNYFSEDLVAAHLMKWLELSQSATANRMLLTAER